MGCRVRLGIALALLVGCGPRAGADEPGTDSTTSTATAVESTADSISTTAAPADTTSSGESTTTGEDPEPPVVCSEGEGFCLAIDPEAPHCFCPEPLGSPTSQPHAVVSADVDGDGRLDVVVGDRSRFDAPSRLRVWRGGADGFAAPSLLAELSVSLETVVLGDLDEDGVLDIVGQPKTGAELPVLHSSGQSLPTGLAMHAVAGSEYRPAVALGDVDADGHLDLVGITNPRTGVMDLWVWPGLGDGTFAEPVSRPLGGDFSPFQLPWLSIVDLDEDGVDDVIAMTTLWMPGVAGGGGALGNSTDLGFSTLRTFADADADGHLDTLAIHHVVDAMPETVPVEVHGGEGQGVFTLLHTWSIPALVEGGWADVDDDGLLDVLFVVRRQVDERSYFALGHATEGGSYDALLESTTPLPSSVGVAAVADLTHDGRSDILAWGRALDDAQSAVLIYVAQP